MRKGKQMAYNIQRTVLKLSLAFALLSSTLSSSVFAATEGEQYFGVQYASTTFEIDLFGEEWSPDAIVGRFGNYLSDNFALEGRIGTGLGDDTITFAAFGGGTIDVKIELDSLFGVYGVGHHTINENSSVYALIGLSRGEATLSATGVIVGSDSETETDLSYGVGINFGISNAAALNLEYISYMSKNDFDLSAISFGFIRKF